MAIFTRTRTDEALDRSAEWPQAGDSHGPDGHWHRVRHGAGRRRWWVAAAVVVLAGCLVGVEVSSGPTTYPVQAVFARAPGLFPGAAVEVVGVPVGTVTSVRNVGDEVRVGLAIDHGRAIPALARAALVSPEILGEPSIDLSPGYTGGPVLRSGAVIPMSRTAVPVSTEQMLKALDAYLKRVNPHAVGGLVSNLAQDLQGQGRHLHRLISGAAGTLQLLATKADDLGQLDGSLAQLTGTLDARSSQITQLITDYDTVSGVVAQHGTELGGAITQLSQASTELVKLLVPNLAPLETDVGTVTTVGRTIDRNLTSIDQILSASTALFTGARRVYTSTYNWLTLNAQLPPGLTGAILAGMVRDRLAGVCRRVLANHAAGLSAKDLQTLQTCGTPASSFFSPIIDEIPTVLNDVNAGKLPTLTSPAKMLQQGLAEIPGTGATTASPSTNGTGTSPSAGSPTPTPGKPNATTTTSHTCLGGLLHTAVKCSTKCKTATSGKPKTKTATSKKVTSKAATSNKATSKTPKTAKSKTATCTSATPSKGSKGTTGTSGTPTSDGGLGGLLSYDVPASGHRAGKSPSLTARATG
ncbi:MAG: MCE family protein, partial [Acidimicrobiales bacterium]